MRSLHLSLLFLPVCLGQGPGCGSPRCGGYRQSPPYQPQPYYPNYEYKYNGYAQPMMGQDKDLTTVMPDSKYTDYEKYEERLGQLKPFTESPIVAPPENITGTTYIRELPYAPQPYAPRPMPYRPHPLLPRGCPVLPPQYVRPTPYMPRGYVTPLPYAPPPQPLPMPLPTLPPLQPLILPTPAPYPVPSYATYPPPNNDCCGRCGAPCRLRQRRHVQAQASKTMDGRFTPHRDNSESANSSEAMDPRCSSEQLRDIMNKSTTRTAALSKRVIQKTAEEELGGFFSVFCSSDDFTYLARSETFCQTNKNNIFCYAFQHN